MTRRDIAVLVTWAAATAAVTLAISLPGTLQATGDESSPTATIATPKLAVNGCELSVRLPDGVKAADIKGGGPLTFELVAANPTREPVQVQCTVSMTGMPEASWGSQRGPSPESLWKDEPSITLAPGRTRVISITPPTKLPNLSLISVNLTAGDKTINGLSVAVGSDGGNQRLEQADASAMQAKVMNRVAPAENQTR